MVVMNRVKILLLESALELVPREIWGHPAVVKNARRRGKSPGETLLDLSLHYHAVKRLKDWSKRGRPDIVHISLLNALESPLNKEGLLETYIHTYNGHIIFIDPSTRIPRNYNRFTGLMEQLFMIGRVPPNAEKPLLYIKTMPLGELLDEIGVKGLILLDEKGEYKKPKDIVNEALKERYAIGIGGFPHGSFKDETYRLADKTYSIYQEPLMTWIVVSRIIESAEHILNIL